MTLRLYHNVSSTSQLPIRYEQFRGERHIVAPVVILTEGVHSGSHGPLYYPVEELAQFPGAWNGVPVTIGHPAEGSANSPDVLERVSVGQLFNTYLDNDRLRAEVWISESQLRQKSPEVLQALNENTPVEVSTGLYSEDDPVSGTWNDEHYFAVARRFRPDHLALLPGAVGACSFADGCGIRANKEGENEMTKLEATLNALSPTEDLRERLEKVSRAIYAMDSPVADNYVQAVYENSVVYRVNPGSQSNPNQTPKLYKRGYSINDNGEVVFADDMVEVREERSFNPVGNEAAAGCGCGEPTEAGKSNEGGSDMPKKTPERTAKVDALLAANVGFAETDREMLENLDCEPFAAIENLANREPEKVPVTIDNEESLLAALENQPALKAKVQLGLETHNQKRTTAIETIKGNAANPFTDEQLNAMELPQLEGMAALAKPAQTAAAPNTNVAEETTDFSGAAGAATTADTGETKTNKVTPMETPRPVFAKQGGK